MECILALRSEFSLEASSTSKFVKIGSDLDTASIYIFDRFHVSNIVRNEMAKELAQSGSLSIEEAGTWKLVARYLGLPGQQPMEKELSFSI